MVGQKKKAVAAVQKYGLRKSYTLSVARGPTQSKDSHRHRQCPIIGCAAVVKRMPPHLKWHHKINDKRAVKELLTLCRKQSLTKHNHNSDTESESVYKPDVDPGSSDETTKNVQVVKPDSDDALMENVCVDNTGVTDDALSFGLFQTWLQSADVGLKPVKSAKQHAFQVRQVLSAVDVQLQPLQLLQKQLLQEKFLGQYVQEKKFSPGTTRSYMTSLVHFYNFMNQQDDISESTKIKIHEMTACVRRWISSYRETCNERTLTKRDTDIDNLITSEHVNTFERSAPARNAVKLIGTASAHQLTPFVAQDYVLVRDYLLAKIVLSNASRTGVLSNMTANQVKHARSVDQHFVVSVAKHKTAWIQGPAKIVLTKCMYSWLNIFVANIRSQFVTDDDDDDMVFLTTNGEPMESSQISRALQSVWQKAGLGNKITCTLVRKNSCY